MKTLVLLIASLISLNISAADVTIKGADLVNAKGSESKLVIKHAGTLNDNPKISVSDKVLSISIPNSGLGAKINKKVNGSALSATMTGEETVAVNVTLPYSLKGRESDVTIALRDGAIDVHYPRLQAQKTAETQVSRAPSITDKAIVLDTEANNAEAEKLDENYLSTLVKKQEKLADEKHAEDKKVAQDDTTQTGTDRVNLTQSGVAKSVNTTEKGTTQTEGNGESRFSVAGYIGKFVAFLAIMIAGFYGVLTLFKKGIIKKGKLGFLHSTKLVEVLSTTHIAPKRTLMMVKAHKQVFLISSSETGVQFLSEINDVAGLIKTGEEEITGSNFDTNLYSANKTDKEFKLKEETRYADIQDDYEMDSLDDMLNDSVPAAKNERKNAGASGLANAYGATNASKAIEKSPVKDQVRFSDQIKTKVKNLKQL